MGPGVLYFAGYVLGITMMVIILAIGAGIIVGYTYKRWVLSPPGSLDIGLRKTYKQYHISFLVSFKRK